MKRVSCLLLLIYCTLTGCTSEIQKPSAVFPLKIGLLADSQLTSQNGFSNFHYRSKYADALVNVSIRPPALECYLAEEMLNAALDKLTQDSQGSRKGVDLILYLGDAANSGGADEIEKVLTILGKHREQTGVPIFIIIGNHDYLGAGNIISPGIRFALLNRIGRPDNPALTKYEVLKKFSEFNYKNNLLPGNRFQYTDNRDALEQNKYLEHDTGLYLGGVLKYCEPGKEAVDIFLLDSSDYKDSPDWTAAAKVGFYGAIGSVSFKDTPGFVSQTSFFREYARTSSARFRLLASHYPKDHFDRITFTKPGQVPLDMTNFVWSVTEHAFSIPTFSKTLNQNLEPLLLSKGKNYWVSAHTHAATMPKPELYLVGGLLIDKYFTALNVGSTTDYRAHVAIIERYEHNKNNRMDDFVGYREIPLFNGDRKLLASIPDAIGEFGRAHADDPDLRPMVLTMEQWRNEQGDGKISEISESILGMLGKKSGRTKEESYWIDVGATVMGLNRKYLNDAWQDQQTEASARNLKAFVEDFISRTGSNREEVLTFLGLLSGAYEDELIPGECNLTPDCLKILCLN